MLIEGRIESARGAYREVVRLSVQAWLEAPLPPTLCFSDTHLVPAPRPWSDDAPEDLVALVEALSEHRILILGDLLESIGLLRHQRAAFEHAPRLQALWRVLRERHARLIIGNHDHGAVALLERLLGSSQVISGGFELGQIRVCHGDGGPSLYGAMERLLGPIAVPVYEALRRSRSHGPERLDNRKVLARVRGAAPFVLFGHTHGALLEAGAANPGCFMGAAQSFLTMGGHELVLWKRQDRDR